MIVSSPCPSQADYHSEQGDKHPAHDKIIQHIYIFYLPESPYFQVIESVKKGFKLRLGFMEYKKDNQQKYPCDDIQRQKHT